MGGHKEECWSLGLVELEFTAHFETGLELARRTGGGTRGTHVDEKTRESTGETPSIHFKYGNGLLVNTGSTRP